MTRAVPLCLKASGLATVVMSSKPQMLCIGVGFKEYLSIHNKAAFSMRFFLSSVFCELLLCVLSFRGSSLRIVFPVLQKDTPKPGFTGGIDDDGTVRANKYTAKMTAVPVVPP